MKNQNVAVERSIQNMAFKKKSHNGIWNLKAQGRYKSNLKAGDAEKFHLLIIYSTDILSSEYIPTVFDNYTIGHRYNGKTYRVNLLGHRWKGRL